MPESVTVTSTRVVTVAEGVYAPGHLGELTQYLPFELVDDVLAETGTVQRRLRALPSRVGVYFVLALALVPGLGYARVWGKVTAGLAGIAVARPSEKALRDLRRRLGPAPLMAMVTAVESRPGTDPDRASFTAAAEAAREQLTAAQGVCPEGPADLLGVIGRAVLASLLPARRLRYSARKVKCATSRYLNRDDHRPATATTIAAIDIAVRPPPLDRRPARTRRDPSTPAPPPPPTRRLRVMAIMSTDPHRAWSGKELAEKLQITPRNLLTQLAEWARLGFLAHTGTGTYAPAAASP